MRVIRIPKRKGEFRTIYAPNDAEMKALRAACEKLGARMTQADTANVAHGFYPGRSPVTNAMQHIGYEYTLTMDLKDFFDSVKMDAFGTNPPAYFILDAVTIELMFPDGAARQGLPTSPFLANIAAAPMDREIVALRGTGRKGRFDCDFRYTRYADDLTFSFDDERLATGLVRQVTEIANKYGFTVNERKTRLQSAKAGRRMITGVAVSKTGVHPTRYMKRRLRAAKFKRNTSEARGLAEWIKLRQPKNYSPVIVRNALKAKPTTKAPNAPRATSRVAKPVEVQTRRVIDL